MNENTKSFMQGLLKTLATQTLSVLIIVGVLGGFVAYAAPGDNPQFATAFNRIFGEADDQDLTLTLDTPLAQAGLVNDSDKLDGFHAADLVASNIGVGKMVGLYTRAVLGGDWECVDINLLKNNSNNVLISHSTEGDLFGGAYSSQSGTDYILTNSNQADFFCMKIFN